MVSRQRLRETLSARAATGAVTLLGLLGGACARLPVDTLPPETGPLREVIEARAHASFDAAVLVKPRESPAADALAAGLAPLLFCEVASGETNAPGLAPQTVFYRAGALQVSGRTFPQMGYVWRAGAGPGAPLRGVRITLDSRGLPVIWEVLDELVDAAHNPVRVLFVAQSLEARARAAFGAPLPGRRFTIEAAAGASPETLVARVLDDGPALMGPEVYIARTGAITAVTCRCMSPQVRRLAATAWYDLQPLRADETEAAMLLAVFPDLTDALRLPPDF